VGRLHAGAEVREADLGEDRVRDDQGEEHEHRRGDVRQQLAEHDPQRAGPLRGGGFHELTVAQGKDLATQRSPDVRNEDERDHQGRDPEAAGGDVDGPVVEAVDREGGTERDPEQDDREGPDQVEEPRDDPVASAAEIGGEQSEDDGQDRADRRRGEADLERVAAAEQKSRAHVAAETVRTQEVRATGCAPLRPDRDSSRHQLDLAVTPELGAAVREDRNLLAVLVDEAARVLVVLP
jgi:hypothetical protein